MSFLDILSGVSALGGLLSSSSAAQRAKEQQQQLLSEMAQQNDANYQNALGQNAKTLYGAAGAYGDQVQSLGRRLGDSLAGAGVYNSSATAGALANAQQSADSSLAQLGGNLQNSAWQLRAQQQDALNRLRFGVANQDVAQTQGNLNDARGGISSFLGNIVQNNLMRSGANAIRPLTAPINGNAGRSFLPGNADWTGNVNGGMNWQGDSAIGAGSALGSLAPAPNNSPWTSVYKPLSTMLMQPSYAIPQY